VAIGVVAIVALITAAGVFVLSGAGGAARSLTAGNAPKSTLVFVDLRTDLPGDQHQKLADFMTHFPGFKDRAQFENGFDELLNRITGQISPQLTYTSAFKTWATGEVSLAVTDLGPGLSDALVSALTGSASPAQVAAPSGCLIAALRDRAAGERWVASEVARGGLVFTPSQYAGTTLYESQSSTPAMGYAFTDKVFLAGTLDAVRAGLDAPKLGSLADSAGYRESMDVLRRDSVARFYIDAAAIVRQMLAPLPESVRSAYGLVGLSLPDISGWVAGSVRAESDHIVVEVAVSGSNKATSPDNRESTMARGLPASTIAVLEVHSVGAVYTRAFDLLAGSGTPEQKDMAKQIGKTLDSFGGIAWLGDADFVLTRSGASYSGGLVVRTPDAGTAAGKKTMLTNLLSLASAGLGGQTDGMKLSVSEETYKGTPISVYTIGNGSLDGFRFSIAARDDLLFAGMDDTFVKQMLDTTPGASLADQDRFRDVMSKAGASNSGFGYLDVASIVDDLGRAALGTDPGTYNLYYAPYFDNLGAVAYSALEGQSVVLRIVVTAR
jgi:hypothetical protein